jgi:hypothetical protein
MKRAVKIGIGIGIGIGVGIGVEMISVKKAIQIPIPTPERMGVHILPEKSGCPHSPHSLSAKRHG